MQRIGALSKARGHQTKAVHGKETTPMSIRRFALAAVAACALSLPGLAVAHDMEGGWHHGGPGDLEFLHGLTLTDAQKQQLHSIVKSSMTQNKSLMEQLHQLREQHITLILTAGSTQSQLAAVLHQEENVRNQLDNAHLAMALQLRDVLTPQQLSQAADLHAKMEALHEQEHEVNHGAHDQPD
jgi:Spy/CpxP family protein refolding chaperone